MRGEDYLNDLLSIIFMNSNERTVLRVETSLATKEKDEVPRPSVPSSNERFKRKIDFFNHRTST